MKGKVLNDRYKILNELGKGGMAIVYEAEDLLLDRKVAIKMLRSEYISDKEFVKKFRHEAKAVARISHPNVVSIFDIGEDKNYHYLVMENIEGRNLKNIINQRAKLSLVESLDIANQICSALVVAHKNNIIHCDIKPHNILINNEKQVKVTDFGIAKAATTSTLTMTDTIMGSAHYFSPEQAQGGDIKTHSDLYSVGIVLYEMLTGEVPFQGKSPVSVALKHIKEDPKPPSSIKPEIPEQVDNLVMKALAKDPEDRFNSALEMRQQITTVLKNLKNEKQKHKTTASSNEGDTKVIKKSDIAKKYQVDNKNNNNNNTNDQKKVKIDSDTADSNYKWLLWTGVIITILGITFLGMGYLYQNYTDVPIVEVPDILGMNYKEAENHAAQVGLELKKQKEIYDSDYKDDEIISQYPVSGEMVRQTRPIMVTISKGPEVKTMPELKNMTYRKAEILLDNKNINIDNIKYVYDDKISKDHILQQQPESGTKIKNDTDIVLTVSKGPKPIMVKVPKLIGLKEAEALTKINKNGLILENITKEKTKRFLEGIVAKQEFKPGRKVQKDTQINITVSKGLINTENAAIYSKTLHVYVRGFEKQNVKIVVIDNNGRDVVFNELRQPGNDVYKTINSVGATTYQVYIDGKLVKEINIGQNEVKNERDNN